MKSEVFFAQMPSEDITQRALALKRILSAANPFTAYKKDEFIPLKLTIGDSACVYNISPQLVKLAVDEIKNKGAKPFLFDTCVIYKGQRQNAVDHLNLAQSKGFSHNYVGAPFIIADGIFGQDGKEYPVKSRYMQKIKVPSFIGMLDSLLVLSHVSGHILSRYAGAIKNVAMGLSCRPSKQVQHSSLKPQAIAKKCTSCGCCIVICPVKAISFKNKKAHINQRICIGCGECICACKFDAININWEEDTDIFCRRMADSAHFILSKFKNKFFLNFAFDITKECDCISGKNEKMVAKDLGILASQDILSLDKATMDLINKAHYSDFFSAKSSIYKKMFSYAAEKKLGSLEYELINL